ncbi:MAG: serine/threonine protein kinase [Gemmatimonadota bacterium]|nr:serine/threonine protein kinase [Gemmatimonadota bacterium]
MKPDPGGADRIAASSVRPLTELVHRELLPALHIESVSPHDPVVVHRVPSPWTVLGRGNYATVLSHPEHPGLVAKVYAPGRPGLAAEREVYHRLGEHPAYSACLFAGDGFLILRRLRGTTLYDAVHQGLPIPEQAIRDIDQALDYARSRGLHPHDVHGRNVMVHGGRGLVVDVSDFLKEEDCSKWQDLRRAYYRIYRPLFMPLRLRVPYFVLDAVRLGYRLSRRVRRLRRSAPVRRAGRGSSEGRLPAVDRYSP